MNNAKLLHKNARQVEYVDNKGIHVIVGHYIGNDMPWDTTPNLTDGEKIFINQLYLFYYYFCYEYYLYQLCKN